MIHEKEYNSILQVEKQGIEPVLDYLSFCYPSHLSAGKAVQQENGDYKIYFNLSNAERQVAETNLRRFIKQNSSSEYLPYCWKK